MQLDLGLDLISVLRQPLAAAPSYSANVQQFFDRLITLPSPANQALYASVIDGLVIDSVWPFLDHLCIYAAVDAATSLINLKSANYQSTLWIVGGDPTFVAYRGWTGVGINENVNSNFNPVTAVAANFVQNNGMGGAWNLTSGPGGNQSLIKGETGSNNIFIAPRSAGNVQTWGANPISGTDTLAGVTDASGWLTVQRTGPTASELGHNGVQVATSSKASLMESDNTHFTCGPWQTAAVCIGASLTAGQQVALYNRLQTYLHAVGAV